MDFIFQDFIIFIKKKFFFIHFFGSSIFYTIKSKNGSMSFIELRILCFQPVLMLASKVELRKRRFRKQMSLLLVILISRSKMEQRSGLLNLSLMETKILKM